MVRNFIPLLVIVISLGTIFFYLPIGTPVVQNSTEQVPYEVYGEYTERVPYTVLEPSFAEFCETVEPNVSAKAVAINKNEWNDNYVQFYCNLYNKESVPVNVTYRMNLGKYSAFAGSSPSGYVEPVGNVVIQPLNSYQAPVFHFNVLGVPSWNDECKIIYSELIERCEVIETQKAIIKYNNVTKNGTYIEYKIEGKQVTFIKQRTIYNITMDWLKIKNLFGK